MDCDAVQVHATDDLHPPRRTPTATNASNRVQQPHSARAMRLPVRPLLLPRRYRPALAALAAFSREVRTLGALGTPEHAARLDTLEAEVRRAIAGAQSGHAAVALLVGRSLPGEPLLALIEAQRLRQRTSAFATYDDLLAYCALASNPIGQIVLAILGRADEERLVHCDAICTALQLTAFWRDVTRDFVRGRVFFPREDMHLFGVTPEDLTRALAHREANPNTRALVAFELERTHALFDRGAPLVTMLRGRARLDCALVIADGRAMLAAIARQGYDPFIARPSLSRTARASKLFGAVRSISAETLHSR